MRKKIIITLIVLVILLIPGITLGVRYLSAPAVGIVEKQEKVQSADFRIFSYEHFYDMTVEIATAEQQYLSQKSKLELLDKDSESYTRTLSNIAALEAHIINLKNQYNADAAKEETVGLFKSNDLPDYIEPELPKED